MKHALALALLGLLACDREAVWERPLQPSAPLALDARVLWLAPGWPLIAALNPQDLSVRILELEGLAHWTSGGGGLFAHPDGRHALLVREDQALYIDAEDLKIERRWTLPTPFARVTFAPDGQRALLHHDPGLPSGWAISNPNQLAILDLSSDVAPITRALMAFGAEPLSIIIDPKRTLFARERQWVWVFSDRYLAFFDLLDPEVDERVVHLVLEDDDREVVPQQIATLDGETFFVRAWGSADIFSLRLQPEAEAEALPRPWLNQLDSGGQADDMLAVDLSPARLFALNASTETLSIINPETGRRVSVALGFTPTRFMPFELEGQPAALLWAEGLPSVAFVDLTRVELERGRAVKLLRLDSGVTALKPLPTRAAAVAVLGANRLAILDFATESAVPLSAEGPIAGLTISEDGARCFAVVSGADGLSLIAVDVATAAPQAVPLGLWRGVLLSLPGADSLVIVDSNASLGRVKVIAADAPLEASALRTRGGILMEGVLTR
ncbi:hypothetical protein KKB55_22760 [Myxococcota bacterium]|nr:hypothetical protein [Myxococcota bacterium]MBU1900577.1 hypothetical protein [Myxococcota bacterium]